ncbi:hypothetical protein FRC08_009332 [Ceratobasidium sp. 394]|nr:hypothetical protein FRC08_009332 [Ceratobasidium sp. 394]
MLYVSYTNAAGVVTHVGYTDDDVTEAHYKEKRAKPKKTESNAQYYNFTKLYQLSKPLFNPPRFSCDCACSGKGILYAIMVKFISMWMLHKALVPPEDFDLVISHDRLPGSDM